MTPNETLPTGASDPDEALEAFIREEFDAKHLGECPSELEPGATPPDGVCSRELYRSAELVTFFVGAPFSEFFGEAVITKTESTWSVDFVPFGELGATVALGDDAVVYGAGDCLRFRTAPSTSADVMSCRIDGTRAEVVEGPVEADNHTWWRLEGLGWASEQYLRPAE